MGSMIAARHLIALDHINQRHHQPAQMRAQAFCRKPGFAVYCMQLYAECLYDARFHVSMHRKPCFGAGRPRDLVCAYAR